MSNGHRFQKGKSGNPKGRAKGSLNKATLAGKAWADTLIADEKHQSAFIKQWRTLKVPVAMLVYVYQLAKGKPKELIEHTGADGAPIQVSFYVPENGRRTR